MIFEKEERLAHKLEDNKNNKIDALKNELSERLKELSLKEPEEQQAYINNLYRGLSPAGTDKLNKVLDLYNKEVDCALKTHDEVMDGYQQTIHETVALLNKYGTEFGKTKETDDFIKSQFAELMSNVKKPKNAKAAGIGALVSVGIVVLWYILVAVVGIGVGLGSASF